MPDFKDDVDESVWNRRTEFRLGLAVDGEPQARKGDDAGADNPQDPIRDVPIELDGIDFGAGPTRGAKRLAAQVLAWCVDADPVLVLASYRGQSLPNTREGRRAEAVAHWVGPFVREVLGVIPLPRRGEGFHMDAHSTRQWLAAKEDERRLGRGRRGR